MNTDRLPNQKAISHAQAKTLITGDIQAYHHALAFTVSRLAQADMLAEIKDGLDKAIKDGLTEREFRQLLTPYLVSKGWLNADPAKIGKRLDLILQTNRKTAHAAAKWQRIQATKNRFPYLKYMPSLSIQKRDEHTKYYGIIRHVDDPIWQSIMPPNGFRCRCYVKRLTEKEAQKEGISDDETVKNLPKPDFDTNHDRLTALLKLAQERHGVGFVRELERQIKDRILDYAKAKFDFKIVNFSSIIPRQSEVKRLSLDKKGESLSEGIIGDKWQQYYNVTLVRYDENFHKVLLSGSPADFAIKDLTTDYRTWITLDVMFTLEKDADVNEFLRSFNKSEKAWENRKKGIIKHLQKSDIVPMYLKFFDIETRIKLIAFVLSLPKELQQKIVFINDDGEQP